MEQFSKVKTGTRTEIWIGRGAGPTWVKIYGCDSITIPDRAPEEIDVTHFDTPGPMSRETIPGMVSVEDYSFDLQYWPGEPTDLLLSELSALSRSGSREVVLLKIIPNGGSEFIFQGYVNSYTPSATIGEAQTVSVSMKIMAQVITDTAPTNSLLPAISGIAQVGQTLTVLNGEWAGAPMFSYQWQEDDGGGFVDIAAATSQQLVVDGTSLGFPIQAVVTGTNEIGALTVTSQPTASVVA